MTPLLAILAVQTRTHEFVYTADDDLTRVNVAGTFNNWNKDATPMVKSGRVWRVKLDLPVGKTYYKFVLDGETWITDPKAQKNEDDGNGNTNSVLFLMPPGYETPSKVGDGQITTSSISHPQEVPFLNWDNGKLYLTLRTRAQDVRRVFVTTDLKPESSKSKGSTFWFSKVTMQESGGDEFTTNWTASLPWNRKTPFHYSFQLEDGGRGPLTFDKAGGWYSREAGKDTRFALDPKTFKPFTVPSWVEKSVVYQIFPDRFANGDPTNDPADVEKWDAEPKYFNWFGGDFAGVRQKVSHLKDLGVGCIYFNPVFEGPSNHRYEATDYKKVDHRLGTNDEFASLTRDMDQQGIKTVLDGVFNHTAVDFFAFDDIVKKQQSSKYLNWYHVKSFPVAVTDPPPYEAWYGFKSMPKLRTETKEVRDYLLSVPDFWAKNAKIAGWRLDVANEVSSDYWKLFRKRVKSHGDQNWIVGEIWGDGSPWLKGDQFDSVMNYQFRGSVLGFVNARSKPSDYWASLMKVYDSYGPQVSRNMMNLLGSHDTARLLNECGRNAQLARLAAMLQFTWVGAPCVYYGDELGMAGDRDPDNRRGMRWDLVDDANPYWTMYKNLSQMRKTVPALQSGDPMLVSADDSTGLLVFKRKLGDQWAIVAINRGSNEQTVTIGARGLLDTYRYSNEPTLTSLAKGNVKATGSVALKVSPLSISVLTSGPSTFKQSIR